jgi:hypothetical protein
MDEEDAVSKNKSWKLSKNVKNRRHPNPHVTFPNSKTFYSIFTA